MNKIVRNEILVFEPLPEEKREIAHVCYKAIKFFLDKIPFLENIYIYAAISNTENFDKMLAANNRFTVPKECYWDNENVCCSCVSVKRESESEDPFKLITINVDYIFNHIIEFSHSTNIINKNALQIVGNSLAVHACFHELCHALYPNRCVSNDLFTQQYEVLTDITSLNYMRAYKTELEDILKTKIIPDLSLIWDSYIVSFSKIAPPFCLSHQENHVVDLRCEALGVANIEDLYHE